MKIIVFGATGQVGSALAERARGKTQDWRFIARNDFGGDFLDLRSVTELLDREAPDVIVNAAAMTAVDKAQTEPDIATAINAQAPGVLARYATKKGAYLIHLSTDYVFDGLGIAAKTEDDSISPINVYGKTKAIAEQAIFEQKCKACVLRLTWVYGVNHPNFVTGTVKKLLSGQQVMAFEDQVGSPTAATDIAEVIIKLVINHENSVTITGLYHFANSGYCSRFECARFIEKCLGERATGMISAIQTSSVKLVAARPLNCRLQTLKIQDALNVTPRSWQEAMVEAVDYLTPQW